MPHLSAVCFVWISPGVNLGYAFVNTLTNEVRQFTYLVACDGSSLKFLPSVGLLWDIDGYYIGPTARNFARMP